MNTQAKTQPQGPHVCPQHLAFFLDNWMRRLIHPPRKLLGAYINPGDTVLDVGCGPGFFTIEMARMVGPQGRVIAADLQQGMLDRVRRKAEKHRVAERIEYHRCAADRVGFAGRVDFILAYYMLHETPDPRGFLNEAAGMLNPGGRILVVEPKMHVSAREFAETVAEGEGAGLTVAGHPANRGGRSVLLALP